MTSYFGYDVQPCSFCSDRCKNDKPDVNLFLENVKTTRTDLAIINAKKKYQITREYLARVTQNIEGLDEKPDARSCYESFC